MKYKVHHGGAPIKGDRMNVDIKQTTIELGAVRVIPNLKTKKRPLIVINNETMQTTDRFWNSLYSRYNISDSFFKYFSHEEVFTRIINSNANTNLKLTVESSKDQPARALALAGANREVVPQKQIVNLFNEHKGRDIKYKDGVITAVFTPPSGVQDINIGNDKYRNNYVMTVPLDGYGMPKIHLSLLRLLCTNGIFGYGKAFESGITAVHDPMAVLGRVLDAYDNDQGFDALASRIEKAQQSYASFREVVKLEGTLLKTEVGSKRIDEYRSLTGFVQKQYGIANPESIATKKQMLLPTKVRVSELIDFATEIATHHSKQYESDRLNAWVGTMLCSEYDLEGSANGKIKEFKDFHLKKA